MLGFIALILGLFVFANFVSGTVFGIYLSFAHALRGILLEPAEMNELIMQNIAVATMTGAILALFFFWIVFLIRRESLFQYSLIKGTSFLNLGFAILMGLGIYFVLFSILTITGLYRFFPEHQEIMNYLIMETRLFVALLSVGLVIPVVEEIAFRGIILNRLRENLPLTAALLLQALVFGIVHYNVLQSSYAFIGGIFLGLAYIWTGSLLVPIFIHVSWNSASVIIAKTIQPQPEMFDMVFILIIGAVLMIASLLYFKYTKENHAIIR